MTAHRSRRGLAAGLVAAAVVVALAILRPWTVVPVRSTSPAAFDPHAYVASIWTSQVLPTAEASAIDLQAYLARQADPAVTALPATRAVFVRGRATVAEIDQRSRVGLARLGLERATDSPAVAIQVGPVLRGTALRDALPFVRFTDFLNQLEFAAVSNALNEQVVEAVLAGMNVGGLAGRDVTFLGAVSTAAGAAIEIVPLHVEPVGEPR
jgi:predicted lipoprotein